MQILLKGGGYDVFKLNELKNLEFDKIFVGIYEQEEAVKTLLENGIKASKIDTSLGHFKARIDFIRSLSFEFKQANVKGCVAELGVYRGEFARFINAFFDEKFYLLDTFSGFDERDLKSESKFSDSKVGEFCDTSLEFVKTQMPFLDRCEFVCGYFPQSITPALNNEKFCFVNLDMDLYEPILSALEFFYPKMVKNGVILVDDYYHLRFKGVKEAVDKFINENKLFAYPIGDGKDIFLIKT